MTKLKYLKWFDILVLSVLLFGEASYLAVLGYQSLLEETTTVSDALEFTVQDDYSSLLLQAILLVLAFAYLGFRKFDLSAWNVKPSLKSFVKGIALFFFVAVAMDLFFLLAQPLAGQLPFPAPLSFIFEHFRLSSVLYAMLNGVYEEIFFLGMCMSVSPKDRKWVLVWAFFVRFIFHIYQGMLSAVGIGFIFGGIFYVLYQRSSDKNLFPFFVAHTIADILGLSILYYLF
ncbi:CPBP family glutamic-type intramembrane protease [Streptococcus cameli]